MRLHRGRRKAVLRQIPPVKCSAKSSRSGGPCRNWAMVGAKVCNIHGGVAPQVRRATEERVTLAEALASGRPRSAWEVLADTLHTVDVLAQQVRQQVISSPDVPPKLLLELVASAERAARFAKTTLDAGVDERRIRMAEGQGAEMAEVFRVVLDGLHLTREQRALVPGLLRSAVEAVTKPAIEAKVVKS